MARPRGLSNTSVVSPVIANAKKLIADKPGMVVFAPLTGPRRRGTINVVIVDDQNDIHSSMGMALIDAGRDFNSMFASNSSDELWLNPAHIREAQQLTGVIQKKIPFQWCLFDIKMGAGSPKNGLELLADSRAADEEAFFIIHSTIATGMAGRQEYVAADLAMTKEASAMQRAQLVYQLVAFHPMRCACPAGTRCVCPNIPTCCACPMYDGEEFKCTAIDSSDATLRFHPTQLCPWLAQEGLQDTLAKLKARGESAALETRIRLVSSYLVGARNASHVKRLIAQANADTKKISLPYYPAKKIRERFPMILGISDVFPLQTLLLEAAGYPRLRPRLEVSPSEKLQGHYEKLSSL